MMNGGTCLVGACASAADAMNRVVVVVEWTLLRSTGGLAGKWKTGLWVFGSRTRGREGTRPTYYKLTYFIIVPTGEDGQGGPSWGLFGITLKC
jgi:hypothetical protein